MNIKMYSIAQKHNVANKVKNATPVFTGDIQPYLGVTNNGTSFILDTAYNVNYGCYDFCGHTYYCWVKIAVNNEGLYIYDFIIDSLTTCYYNGDLNSNQLVVREQNGSDKLIDNEITRENVVNISQWDVNEEERKGVAYIVNVMNVGQDDGSSIEIYTRYTGDYAVTGNTSTLPNVTTYVLTPFGFRNFYMDLMGLANTSQWIQCILSVYAVDYLDVFNSDMTRFLTDVGGNGIVLTRGTGSFSSLIGSGIDTEYVGGRPSFPNAIYRLSMRGTLARHIEEIETGGIEINGNTIDDVFQLDVRHCGTIQFTPQEFNINRIDKIGYRKNFDFVSGNVRVELMLNGSPRTSKFLNCQISELIPMMSNESMSSFFSIASTVGSTALAVATEGVSTVGAIAGGITGVASTVAQDYLTSGSVSGSTGGDIYRSTCKLTRVYRFHRPATNFNAYQERFGKPSYAFHYLGDLTGYLRTENCEFNSTLPFEIVQQAQDDCDSGIYII